ncbi:MAG: aspartyl/asparaginyl beta-hydroxylase domain-containing protein [Pseudomonadales bacterium]|nr:aspartyl/asparaginyl beta-hydroxylase domain-containing protein [Pseudomonadales bacterium]
MSVAYSIARAGMTKVYNAFVKTPSVLSEEDFFPGAQAFVDNWQTLRKEALSLTNELDSVPRFHDLMPEQYQLSAHGEKEWRMFVLRAYGLDIQENLNKCPKLRELVSANPSIKSASLSFLAPGKQVPTHTGPFRGITRFYMGLEVPADASGKPGVVLTIDDESYRLGNGEALLWDDTYPHSVQNNTDQWRIALLLDVYRAHMPGPLRLFTNAIIGMARFSIKWRKIFPEEFA